MQPSGTAPGFDPPTTEKKSSVIYEGLSKLYSSGGNAFPSKRIKNNNKKRNAVCYSKQLTLEVINGRSSDTVYGLGELFHKATEPACSCTPVRPQSALGVFPEGVPPANKCNKEGTREDRHTNGGFTGRGGGPRAYRAHRACGCGDQKG